MKHKRFLIVAGFSALLSLTTAFVAHPFYGMSLSKETRRSAVASAINTLPNLEAKLSSFWQLDRSPSPELADTPIITTDLLITKSSSPSVATAGEPLTYTIVVSNTGPATAYNLTIVDTLPAGIHFQEQSTLTLVKGSDPQLHLSLRTLTGTVGSLLPTGHVKIIGRTLVEATSSGATISNSAYVTATNVTDSSNQYASIDTILLTATPTPTPSQSALPTTSPIATVPTATATPTATPTLIATTAPNQADLEIKKSVAYKAVIAGAILTYTIQINNLGPGPAHNIAIQDQLPAGLLFEGLVRLSVLRGDDSQLLVGQEQLTATIGVLHATGIISITAPVRTASTGPTAILVNQANVTSTTPDPQPGNNRATASLTVIAAPPSPEQYFLPLIRQ